MTIEYRVLGGLELRVDGVDLTPSAPKVRQVLALLLARAGRVVPADTIVREVWDDRPPASAATTTQTYVYQLRRVLARVGDRAAQDLSTHQNGYCLSVDPLALDERTFRDAVARGRAAFGAGRYREASTALRQAELLCPGEPYEGLDHGPLLQAHALELAEVRAHAVEVRIESDMLLGRHRELIGELRLLVAEHPFDEWLHGRLVQALGKSGRRSEALQAYQSMRTLLDTELGLRPSAESRRLHAELLNA